MGTKTQSSSSGNQATNFIFDPNSLKQYQSLLNAWSPQAQAFINNPYGNPQYSVEQSMGQHAANVMGQRGTANVLGNARAAGFNANMPGFLNSQLNAASRGTAELQANQWQSAFLNAGRRQQASMGLAASFQPLMTGSNSNFANQSQTQTSGLGTWLPQVLGAAGGMAMSAMTGGMSGMGGGGGASGGGGGGGGGGGFGQYGITPNYGTPSMSMGNSSNPFQGFSAGYAPQANSANPFMPGNF